MQGCCRDMQKHMLCKTIITLVHRMNMIVVAEGVESADDMRCLQAMKCDVAQGFLFAKPMPKEEYLTLLQARAVEKRAAMMA